MYKTKRPTSKNETAQKVTYQQFGRTRTVYRTQNLPDMPRTVILTKDSHGMKAGTLGLDAGGTIQSGFNMTQFIAMDKDFHDYLSKNGFETIRDYILYQHEENFAVGANYWRNPFYCNHIYDDSFVYVDDLQALKEKKQKQIDDLQNEVQHLDMLIEKSK